MNRFTYQTILDHIDYYVQNSESLSENEKQNIINYINSTLASKSVLSLKDLHKQISNEIKDLEVKIKYLSGQIARSESIINSPEEIEEISKRSLVGETPGDVLTNYNTLWQQDKSKLTEFTRRKEILDLVNESLTKIASKMQSPSVLETIKYYSYNFKNLKEETLIKLSDGLIAQFKCLSAEELRKLKEGIARQIEEAKERVSTLTLELTSRKGKMQSSEELIEIASRKKTTPGELLVKLNEEVINIQNEKERLDTYITTMKAFSSQINETMQQKKSQKR